MLVELRRRFGARLRPVPLSGEDGNGDMAQSAVLACTQQWTQGRVVLGSVLQTFKSIAKTLGVRDQVGKRLALYMYSVPAQFIVEIMHGRDRSTDVWVQMGKWRRRFRRAIISRKQIPRRLEQRRAERLVVGFLAGTGSLLVEFREDGEVDCL